MPAGYNKRNLIQENIQYVPLKNKSGMQYLGNF